MDPYKSEEEGDQKKDDDEAEEVPEHVLDDGDQRTESAEYFGLLQYLNPEGSNEDAKEVSGLNRLSIHLIVSIPCAIIKLKICNIKVVPFLVKSNHKNEPNNNN